MEIIISAVISAASAIIVCLISNISQSKKSMEEIKKFEVLQTYRIEQLEKQSDKHEHMMDKVSVLEKDIGLYSERIKNTDYRIMNLEQIHKG